MQVLAYLHGFDFLGKPYSFIVVCTELLFCFEVRKLENTFSTNHETLDIDNLPENPLQNLTDCNKIHNDNAVIATRLRGRLDYSYYHTQRHKYYADSCLVKPEASGNNVKTHT